jgi:hypothetical protein
MLCFRTSIVSPLFSNLFEVPHTGPTYKIEFCKLFGVHPTSYPMGTGGRFPGVKRPGRESDNSPPARAKVKKMSIYTSTTPYASCCALKHRDRFT